MPFSLNRLILGLSALLFFASYPAELRAEILTDVKVDRNEVDLLVGDTATITWRLTESAEVSVLICDLKGNIMKNLVRQEEQESGEHSTVWDGRDDRGGPCPNGVYVPIVKVNSPLQGTIVSNPTALSWGEDVQALDLQFNGGSVSFTVDRLTYGRLRVGLKEGGPVFKTLAPWRLWAPGRHDVKWNGKDREDFHKVAHKETLAYSFDAFTLPENILTVSGSPDDNPAAEYDQFPVHPPASSRINFFALEPGSHNGEPAIEVSWQKGKKQGKEPVPLKGKVQGRVSFAEPHKRAANLTSGSELILYIDDEYVTESPIDELPATISFDTGKYANGEHLVTVNLLTADDRAGIHLEKVIINN